MEQPDRKRVVVLISGSGTLLQALLDAAADLDYGVEVVAVGSDRDKIAGLDRARSAGVATFVHPLPRGGDRAVWDRELAERVGAFAPDLVISAGFMKLVGPAFLDRFAQKMINTHPSLLPSFPGMHGPRDALAYGVKVTGATIFLVGDGVDDGVIIDQRAVQVHDDDDVDTLHERIKISERALLVDTTHRLLTRGWRVIDRKVSWDR